jgi:hypothetical protein
MKSMAMAKTNRNSNIKNQWKSFKSVKSVFLSFSISMAKINRNSNNNEIAMTKSKINSKLFKIKKSFKSVTTVTSVFLSKTN